MNFNFLTNYKQYDSFSTACIEAEKGIIVSPANSAILSRRALELAVKWLYIHDVELKMPYQEQLSSLIHESTFQNIIDEKLFPMIKYIVKLGNVSVHSNNAVSRQEAVLSLHNLFRFISWIDYCYGENYEDRSFDESVLPDSEYIKITNDQLNELKLLQERLAKKDKKLADLLKENEYLRRSGTEKRKENIQDYDFNVDEISEYETRKRYIDLDLKEAGWTFGKDVIEELKVAGMPNNNNTGYVDYVLYGNDGKPIALIEAKRTSKDPKIGQQQAKLYADCIEKEYNLRPIIFFSNGFETHLWDDANYPERVVSGIFTKEKLELMIDRRTMVKSFNNLKIDDNITNRYYQKEAIMSVCDALENKQRKFLLVMATGSGKTRVAISIVDILTKHNYVKNILFLADRTALVKQAKKNFNNHLPNLTLCNLLDNKDNPESARMIFSTYPTMMNAIDEAKSKAGKKLFTPGHFDLIIIDESHRSIYKKYKAIFQYFDALLLGLTATPKDEIDINTYSVFDLESGVPTYAYELEQAVKDGFLVAYKTYEVKTKIMEEGIKYDDLSPEEKELYEETFEDDTSIGDEISNTAVNEWLFNSNTIDKVIETLMVKGIKVEGADKIGKTIIFAKSHKHAIAIDERFNLLYPNLKGEFASVIDNQINYASTLIDSFSEKDKMPQIAISVDMLDTGIDIPEVVNLVFFKKVRSKSKFWQMIGRGTRLCEDLFGPGLNKKNFLIFDFCNNFEFFKVKANGIDGKIIVGLTERIFNYKIDLIKELQEIKFQEEPLITYRKNLLCAVLDSVKSLNEDLFTVKLNLYYVHKYKNEESWESLSIQDAADIKEYISPLIPSNETDENAKRFDILIYAIELAFLTSRNANRFIKTVMITAENLSKLGTIPEIIAKKEYISLAKDEKFWNEAGITDFETIREELRDLLKYLESEKQKIYYTNFSDIIVDEKSGEGFYDMGGLENYKKKVEHYLSEHRDQIAVNKLRMNKRLNKTDLKSLEDILWKELGTREDYKKEFGDTPVTKLVRRIAGLDLQAANEAFSEFLTDESLNIYQMRFVKLIVDYIVKNGLIEDKRVMNEDPFKSVGSISSLFKHNKEKAMKIVEIIDDINRNSEEIDIA